MGDLSAQTLVMTVQAVDAEIRRIKESVNGDVNELDPDTQELLMAYSQAAMELKACYLDMRKCSPSMPPYEQLVASH